MSGRHDVQYWTRRARQAGYPSLRDWLWTLRWSQGMTERMMAADLGITPNAVHLLLARAGIPRRGKREAQQLAMRVGRAWYPRHCATCRCLGRR